MMTRAERNAARARGIDRRRRELAGQPPPGYPAGSDWRPVAGFPRFAVTRAGVVMTSVKSAGWPCPWRPAPLFLDGSKGTVPSVHMRDEAGVIRTRSVAKLLRITFEGPAPPPTGPIGGPGGDDRGDEADDMARGMPAIGAAPRFARMAEPQASLPPPARSPEPAVRPAPLGRPRDVGHPGGRRRVGFHARGNDIPQAKLDPAKAAELKLLRSEGWSAPRLAARYGISVQAACNVFNGKAWAHVEPASSENGGTA